MSLRKAIDAKCRDCAYDELDRGNWRQQIEACTSTGCALWPYRPVTGKTKRANADPAKSAWAREHFARQRESTA